jgi:hypothetical protein
MLNVAISCGGLSGTGFLRRRPRRGNVGIVEGILAPILQHTLTSAFRIHVRSAVEQTGNRLHGFASRPFLRAILQKVKSFGGAVVLEHVCAFWRLLLKLGKYHGRQLADTEALAKTGPAQQQFGTDSRTLSQL